VVQIGQGPAAAVCGRLLADVGAQVSCIEPGAGSSLMIHLNHGKAIAAGETAQRDALLAASLIVREGTPKDLALGPWDLAAIRRINASAVVVTISPYGETGPQADDPATDLRSFCQRHIAPVDRAGRRPVGGADPTHGQPVGFHRRSGGRVCRYARGARQSTAPASTYRSTKRWRPWRWVRACGPEWQSWARKRLTDGNGATVTILPARDGYTAISCARKSNGRRGSKRWDRPCGAPILASPGRPTGWRTGTRSTR
jgi:hypothetical protein